METAATSGKSVRIVLDQRDYFGKTFDYYMYGLHTNSEFPAVINSLAIRCHCVFTLLPALQLSNHKTTARFPLAFSQFDLRGPDMGKTTDYVEKLNIVIFQNFTEDFQHIAADATDRIMNFEAEEPLPPFCFALNNIGLRLCSWDAPDVRFLVFIFAKKGKDADDFVAFFDTLHVDKLNLTHLIREEHTQFSDKQHLTKNVQKHVAFVRSIVNQAQVAMTDYSNRCVRENNSQNINN